MQVQVWLNWTDLQVKVQQGGVWSAGICSPGAELGRDLGLDSNSWAITSTGQVLGSLSTVIHCREQVRTRGEAEYSLGRQLEEGDILGFSYDHVEVKGGKVFSVGF